MSRAVPSSYNEYLYTSSTNMICDGGIMPLRTSSDPTSTWYKYCLRGEDPIFINEALNVRGKAGSGSGTSITPTELIQSSKMAAFRDSIGYMWRSGGWSSTAPNMPAGVLQDASTWGDYVKQYLTLPSVPQSAGDTYTVLDASQVMNLFKDIKNLNYAYTLGGRGSVCPYNYSQSCTWTVHEEENRSYYQPADPDYDQTSTSYLWYSQENLSWYKNLGYPGDLECSTTWTPKANSLTFTERTSNPTNLYKTCVEIQPWAEMYVDNQGNTSDYNGQYGDQVYDYKYVIVPLKSGYTDMLNETVPTVNSSELDTAISLAFSTAGLAKNCSDIPMTPATGDHTYRSALSTCRIWTLFYLVHFKYCSLESITIQ